MTPAFQAKAIRKVQPDFSFLLLAVSLHAMTMLPKRSIMAKLPDTIILVLEAAPDEQCTRLTGFSGCTYGPLYQMNPRIQQKGCACSGKAWIAFCHCPGLTMRSNLVYLVHQPRHTKADIRIYLRYDMSEARGYATSPACF